MSADGTGVSYELWATDGANLVASYETEAEALEAVAELAKRYRSRPGRRLEWLALLRSDLPPGQGCVAEGADLVARALGHGEPAARPHGQHRKRAAA